MIVMNVMAISLRLCARGNLRVFIIYLYYIYIYIYIYIYWENLRGMWFRCVYVRVALWERFYERDDCHDCHAPALLSHASATVPTPATLHPKHSLTLSTAGTSSQPLHSLTLSTAGTSSQPLAKMSSQPLAKMTSSQPLAKLRQRRCHHSH